MFATFMSLHAIARVTRAYFIERKEKKKGREKERTRADVHRVTVAKSRETRKWHFLVMHSLRALVLGFAVSPKMQERRGAMHPSPSIVDVARRWCLFQRNSRCTFQHMYVHLGRFFVSALRLCSTTFPSSRAFLCRCARERAERKRECYSRAARRVVQRLLSTTVSSSSIIFHDMARQVVYRSSLAESLCNPLKFRTMLK